MDAAALFRIHYRDREEPKEKILLQRRQIEAPCGILDRQPIVAMEIGQPPHCASQALALRNYPVHGFTMKSTPRKCIDELQ